MLADISDQADGRRRKNWTSSSRRSSKTVITKSALRGSAKTICLKSNPNNEIFVASMRIRSYAVLTIKAYLFRSLCPSKRVGRKPLP
jgi:hypothetical protein